MDLPKMFAVEWAKVSVQLLWVRFFTGFLNSKSFSDVFQELKFLVIFVCWKNLKKVRKE